MQNCCFSKVTSTTYSIYYLWVVFYEMEDAVQQKSQAINFGRGAPPQPIANLVSLLLNGQSTLNTLG